MNKEKFNAVLAGLTGLINDYQVCKNDLSKLALEETIVSFADNFVKMYRRESVTDVKKSELPRNCKRDETPNDDSVFQNVFVKLKKEFVEWSNDEELLRVMAQLITNSIKKGC